MFGETQEQHDQQHDEARPSHLQEWGDDFETRNTYMGMSSKVTLSAIEGGWPHRCSRVPVYCTLYVDTRLMPGQSPLLVRREMEEAVASPAEARSGLREPAPRHEHLHEPVGLAVLAGRADLQAR